DQTIAGGKFVDLGGFRNFVHSRDLTRPITLKFEIDLTEEELPTYITPGGALAARDYEPLEFNEVPKSSKITVSIAWSELRGGLYVRDYGVEINGTPLARIECHSDERGVYL